MIRICVCIDVDTDNLKGAYKAVHDALCELPEGMEWESTDEWYDDAGERIDEDALSAARLRVLHHASSDDPDGT